MSFTIFVSFSERPNFFSRHHKEWWFESFRQSSEDDLQYVSIYSSLQVNHDTPAKNKTHLSAPSQQNCCLFWGQWTLLDVFNGGFSDSDFGFSIIFPKSLNQRFARKKLPHGTHGILETSDQINRGNPVGFIWEKRLQHVCHQNLGRYWWVSTNLSSFHPYTIIYFLGKMLEDFFFWTLIFLRWVLTWNQHLPSSKPTWQWKILHVFSKNIDFYLPLWKKHEQFCMSIPWIYPPHPLHFSGSGIPS